MLLEEDKRNKIVKPVRGLEDYKFKLNLSADSTIVIDEGNVININALLAEEGDVEYITDEYEVGEDDLIIEFKKLTIDNLHVIPTVFQEGVKVGIHSINNDSDVFIHSGSITQRKFTVSRKTGIQEDIAKVQFRIKGRGV